MVKVKIKNKAHILVMANVKLMVLFKQISRSKYNPNGTRTWVLGMSDQHAIHYSTAGVGKKWAPISPIA